MRPQLSMILAMLFLPLSMTIAAGPKLVLSKASELQLKKYDQQRDIARFSGSVWIEATLNATWVNGFDTDEKNQLSVSLRPNAAALKTLPQFESYPLEAIEISNEQAALRLAFGAPLANELELRNVDSASIRASFLIAEYEIGIDCNAAFSYVRVLRVTTLETAKLGSLETVECR